MRNAVWVVVCTVAIVGCSLDKTGTNEFEALSEASVADSTPTDSSTDDVAMPETLIAPDTALPDTSVVVDSGIDVVDATDAADAPDAMDAADVAPGLIEVSGVNLPAGTIDLTSEGTFGWVHWGSVDAKSIVQKAGTNWLSAIAAAPIAAKRGADFPLKFSWSDGDPLGTVTAQNGGIYVDQKDAWLTFDADASDVQRTLKVYGEWFGNGVLIASLSDKSAPDVYAPVPIPGSTGVGNIPFVYTVRYRARATKQRLSIVLYQNSTGGLLTLHAATLQ